MTFRFRLLCYYQVCLFFFVISSGSVAAADIHGVIKNDLLRWTSANSASSGLAPAIWEVPGQLASTDVFIPGGPLISSLPLTFTGPNGGAVSFTLNILGVEYNSPESDNIKLDNAGGSAQVTVNHGVVSVDGVGLGNNQITLSKNVSPFTHIRPIFSLGDNADIVRAFLDASLIQGDYIAQVLVPIAYDYYRAGIRVRHNIAIPLKFIIKYDPATLTEVKLVSATGGVITPQYAQRLGLQVVSGQTIFNGSAIGRFPNGLRVRLKSGDLYEMLGPDNTSIPFSVMCHGCEESRMVEQGVLLNNSLTTVGTRIDGRNATQLTFSVMVDFIDINVESLRTGNYQGMFTMLFEPDV
ncbi:hypothetical protein RIMD111065_33220 [Aeromonas hydrophila]|nr:hypothetical protein [Aeromonas hydrophila]BCO14966.1 hypothetical protein RIMD111065_33220 [Aeromonas hydrophila]